MTVLAGAQVEIAPSAYSSRVVAPEWMTRVKGVMRRGLYGYQADGAAWLSAELAAGRSPILADEPGLGKSTQTIAALSATGMYPAIVVVPASLKFNWAREFQYAKYPPPIEIVRGRRGPLVGGLVLIINYDLLKFREEQLLAIGAKCIVFDEAHELKEARPSASHRAAVATRLVRAIGRTILLTGTPALNRPSEMWRLLHMVDNKEWPSFDDFLKRYTKPPPEDEVPFALRPVKRVVTSRGRIENVDEFQVRVQPVMLRRLKSEVQKDLPPKSRRSMLVALDDTDTKAYKAAERDVVAWLKAQGRDAKARAASRAIAIVRLTMLRKMAAIGKMRNAVPDYLEQWFARADPDPLVIFAYHKDILNGLYQITQGLGLRVVGIGDGQNIDKRQMAVDAFQGGYSDVFIAPIKAAGVGINLHRASDSLFIERDWTPSRMSQCEDRLHRLGTKRPVVATYLDAADTIDEYIAEVLDAKQKLITTAVDGTMPEELSPKAEAEASLSTVDSIMERFAERIQGAEPPGPPVLHAPS